MYKNLLSFIDRYKYHLLYALAIPIVCLSSIAITKNNNTYGEWYATNIFPILPNTIGRLLSILPFSLFEIGIISILALLSLSSIFFIKNLFNKSGRSRIINKLPKAFILFICILSSAFLMLTLTCSLNYSRVNIGDYMSIPVSSYSHDDLVSLCLLLIDDIAEIEGVSGFSSELTRVELHEETKAAMMQLGKSYPTLSGYYPNPKPVIFSKVMSKLNLTGIFSPFTTEANYNQDVLDYIIPYTICHELAHLKGYIKEDDAGFIAYLACSQSDNIALKYSGALNALNYSLNALYRDSSIEEYQAILAKVPNTAMHDLLANNAYWNEYRGRVSEISTSANDVYLKANAQVGGVKTYGKMVDLLLAYYGYGNTNSPLETAV